MRPSPFLAVAPLVLLHLAACPSDNAGGNATDSTGSSGAVDTSGAATTVTPADSSSSSSSSSTATASTSSTDPTDPEPTYTVSSDAETSTAETSEGPGTTAGDSSTTEGPASCPEEFLPSQDPTSLDGDNVRAGDDSFGSCGGNGGDDVVVEFVAPVDGTYRIDTFGSSYDTVLYVLDACDGNELACNDDAGTDESMITIDLVEGQVIALVIDGADSQALGLWVLHAQIYECAPVDIGSSVPHTELGTTLDAGDDSFGLCGGAGSPDVELVWTAPASSNYSFSTVGSSFDTILEVRNGVACDGPEISCNDAIAPTDFGPSAVVVALDEGQQVLITVDGFSAFDTGDFTLSIDDVGAFAGDCCSPHAGGGCGVENTWQCVCSGLPQCCTDEWTQICVGIDNAACGGACELTPAGNCCDAGVEAGCDAPIVEGCVCSILPGCCDVLWDDTCAMVAAQFCAAEC
jgi:hypothetical protein